MSYVKQNFVDGQTLTAAQLNHMEAGIANAAGTQGEKGDKGEKGDPGPAGAKGDPGEGFTANAKALLLNLFENAAYKTDTMQPTLNALRAEWGGSAQEVPVQSVSLSAVTMTLNESESKTLTATVLPANATDRAVVWSVLPTGFATVANGVVTGIKAGNCTVTATAGGKSASCAVTVEVVETAQLIYSLPGETVLTQGLDTGLKLLEHASTETPQYTILVDAKAGDDFNANTWPAFLHCLTETGDTGNLPGFNSTSSPLNKKTEFAYYNYGGVTLNESESKTLTATVLPANATDRAVVWSVLPTGFATVANGVVTGIKAGNCTVTATAGGKSASCAVTVEVVETAQLIYSLPGETVLTQGLDTGLKLLEHASTETPQYTILVDAKAGDDFNANTWPAFLHCLTETGDTGNLPGFNSTSSPLNKKTEFAYYNYGGVTLSDSIEHFKTRTRYAVQIDGRKYRGGSTYCPLTEWKTTNGTIIDVPQTFLIGAAQSADGSKKQQFWSGTLYQCKVYKGLLSDDKVNDYIEKGW